MKRQTAIDDTADILVSQGACELHSIEVGQAHLVLTMHRAHRAIRHELDALSPWAQATEFVGREDELARLHQFLADPRLLLMRVIVANGGVGKTRLAFELCQLAMADGWDAGFVSRLELERFLGQPERSSWGWQKPTLIVVDEAASYAQELSDWLEQLASRPTLPGHVLRVLFLERHASTFTGWWHSLFCEAGPNTTYIRELLDPVAPVILAPLASATDRSALVKQMRFSKSGQAGIEEPDVAIEVACRDGSENPLYLAMLGLLPVGHWAALATGLSRREMASIFAKQESQRIRNIADARGLDPQFLVHLAACAGLAQGFSREECMVCAENEQHFWGCQVELPLLVKALEEALPGDSQVHIAPLPRLITAEFCVGAYGVDSQAVAVRLYSTFGLRVVHTLIRLAQDEIDEGGRLAISWLGALIDPCQGDVRVLNLIADSTSPASLGFGEMRAQVTQALLQQAQNQPDLIAQAKVRFKHATALAQMGQREASVSTAAEAVAVYREHGGEQDQPHLRIALAQSLSTLAHLLNDIGQRDVALQVALESADICRWLVAQVSRVYRHDLARSLSTVARIMSILGRHHEALSVAREACKLRSDAFQPDRAQSFNELANMLYQLGQREEALAAAEQAEGASRELVAQWPDIYRPDWASSLNTLANMLSGLGRRDAAAVAAQQASELYAQLALHRPMTFRPGWAASLINRANALSAIGQTEGALSAARQGAQLFSELAIRWPKVFRSEWAKALNSLTNTLSAMGLRDEALSVAQDALDICIDLASQWPDIYRADWACSLNTLSNLLSASGQRHSALAAVQQALGLYRELVTQRPDVFRPILALTYNNLVGRLSAVGQHKEALAAAQEALTLLHELAAQRPDVFRPNLAALLNNLAGMLRALGMNDEALQVAKQAASHFHELALQRPATFRADWAASLNTLANSLFAMGHLDEALVVARQSVELYRELDAQRPAVFRSDLARSINTLANVLSGHGQLEEALVAARQAVNMRRELVAQEKEAFLPELASSLNSLSNRLSALGHVGEALAVAQQSVDLFRELWLHQPEPYRFDLARSLAALGLRREEARDLAGGRAAFAEGIDVLTPAKETGGQLFEALLQAMVKNYLRLY